MAENQVSTTGTVVLDRPVIEATRDQANADQAKSAKDGALLLRDGFRPATRRATKDGAKDYADDILDRQIFQAMAKDVLKGVDLDNVEKNVYKQISTIVDDLTNPEEIEERIDALAARLKAKAVALRNCNTARVTLRHGIPCVQFVGVYIGFAPKRADLQATMLQAPLENLENAV